MKANDFIDLTIDIEATNKRAGMRITDKPPRITQLAMVKTIFEGGAKKSTPLIGAGPDAGWTNLIEALVQKHNIQHVDKIPPAFWRELTDYGPGVVVKGNILHEQVRKHIQAVIHVNAMGGNLKSGIDLIQEMMSHVQEAVSEARTVGKTVRFRAWSMGFDVGQIYLEAFRHSPETMMGIKSKFAQWEKEGLLKMVGAERGVHRAMFEKMLRSPDAIPVFSKATAFDAAVRRGFEPSQITLSQHSTKDLAKREFFNDLIKARKGSSSAYPGMHPKLQKMLGGVTDKDVSILWKQYQGFVKELEVDPFLQEEFTSYYKSRVAAKSGVSVAAHVRTPWSMEMMLGWGQESVSKAAIQVLEQEGKPVPDIIRKIAHEALPDIEASVAFDELMQDKEFRRKVGDVILSPEHQTGLIQEKFGKYKGEVQILKPGLVGKPQEAALRKIASPAGVAFLSSSMKPNPPLLMAAGGLFTIGLLSRRIQQGNAFEDFSSKVADKIEGLRQPSSAWGNQEGIVSGSMSGSNVSDFGSGRRNPAWEQGEFRGTPLMPGVYSARQWYGEPGIQSRLAAQETFAKIPKGWGRLTDTEQREAELDMSEFVYTLQDADTISLHRAWLNRDIPIIGPSMGIVQKHIMDTIRTTTHTDFGIQIRVTGLDAPEMEHDRGLEPSSAQPGAEAATEAMDRLMSRATRVKIVPGMTYGRYIGTPYAGSTDLSRELVKEGHAMALSLKGSPSPYKAEEEMAFAANRGMWESPYFQGVKAAKRRGLRPVLNQLVRQSKIATSLHAAGSYSAAMMYMNPQRAQIRDPYIQNAWVMPYQSRPVSNPINYGKIYS